MQTIITPITGLQRAYGGVACDKIEILDASGAHIYGDVVAGKYDRAIKEAEGYEWEVIHCAEASITFQERQQDREGSLVYEQRLQFSIPKDSADRVNTLRRRSRKLFLVRWIDGNGQGKMMGLQKGCSLLVGNRTNRSTNQQLNEVLCEFRFCSTIPLPGYPFESEIFDGECCTPLADCQCDEGGSEPCAPAIVNRINGQTSEVELLGNVNSGDTFTIDPIMVVDESGGNFNCGAGKSILVRYDPSADPAAAETLNIVARTETLTGIILEVDPIPQAAGTEIGYHHIMPGQIVSRSTHDAADLVSSGALDYTMPMPPMRCMQLDPAATESLVRGTFYGPGGVGLDRIYPTILKENNAFGNRYRFTDDQGNPSDSTSSLLFAHVNFRGHSFTGATPDYVIDHWLGIGFMIRYATIDGKFDMTADDGKSWEDWLTAVNGLVVGSYNDFFIPTVEQALMLPYGQNDMLNEWAERFLTNHYTSNLISVMTSSSKAVSKHYQIYYDAASTVVNEQDNAQSSGFPQRLVGVFPVRLDRRQPA